VIRILLVDDHPVVRHGLRGMLDAEPDLTVVGEAGSGETGVSLAAAERPDIVLMDLRMPEGDGVSATERILATVPGTKVMVLTTYESDRDILRAIEAGACGYLLKDAASEDVAEGIRAAARGESPLDPRAARTVLSARSEPDPLAGLSQREREVLDALVEGLPNKLIARRLEISEKTVKSHLTRVFRELDVTDRTQAALWAERHGVGRKSH